jgi:hypothetical protein
VTTITPDYTDTRPNQVARSKRHPCCGHAHTDPLSRPPEFPDPHATRYPVASSSPTIKRLPAIKPLSNKPSAGRSGHKGPNPPTAPPGLLRSRRARRQIAVRQAGSAESGRRHKRLAADRQDRKAAHSIPVPRPSTAVVRAAHNGMSRSPQNIVLDAILTARNRRSARAVRPWHPRRGHSLL